MAIVEARAARAYRWRPGITLPDEGTLLLNNRFGYLRHETLALMIRAPSEDLVIAAARALAPMPD